jgi:DNA (cytosine-5)-methyltransferase 3A
MKVLSLFDGISCGMVALERAGIPVERYVAYEIETNAIKVSKKNYPQIEHCGDVTVADFSQYSGFDLLIGGSPCQDLSSYKRYKNDAKGLEGSKSNLFFHYVRALKECKPKYFLLENVASMEKRWADVITEELGVEPIMINSSLVCAADRKRLYWTNIPNVSVPSDKGLYLRDIVLPATEVPEKYWYTDRPFRYNGDDADEQATLLGKGFMTSMRGCRNLNAKCNTLLCDGGGGNRQKKVYQDGRCRKLMPIEYERLQNLPDRYTEGVADCHRYTAVGNGWTVDVIAHIFANLKNETSGGS